jgi:hypothetical protein
MEAKIITFEGFYISLIVKCSACLLILFTFDLAVEKSHANPELSERKAMESWQFVPNDIDGVGQIDVERFVKSGLLKKLLDFAEENRKDDEPSAKELLRELHLDPLEDIDDVMLVFYGSGNVKSPKKEGGIIVEGRFKSEAIFKKLMSERPDVYKIKIGEVPALAMKQDKDSLLAIVSDQFLFAGTEDFVKNALQLNNGIGKALSPSDSWVVEKASGIKDKALWVSSKIEPLSEKTKKKGAVQIGPDVSNVKHLLAGLDFGEGDFSLELTMECRLKEEANTLKAELQSAMMMFGGMVSFFTEGDKEASSLAMELMEAIELNDLESSVMISLSMDRDLTGRLKDVLVALMQKSRENERPNPRPESTTDAN